MPEDKTQLWDFRFLDMSELISGWSKDPSTKVGSVIVDENNRIISVGYNGFPKNVSDDKRLDDREKKYKIIVHAEVNAILFAKNPLDSPILYTYPFMPCSRCAGLVIQSGIKRVVSYKNTNPRWEKDFNISRQMFQEAGVEVLEYEPVSE